MQKIIYTTLFVKDPQELLSWFPPKHANVFAHHVTIAFRPPTLEGVEVGKVLTLKILGRATDEKGDALLVERYKTHNAHPHITLSSAEGVPPAYSRELLEKAFENKTIEMVDEPYEVSLVEGFFDGEKDCLSP